MPAITEGDDRGVWLTKAEFAERRQISQASADRLIRRQGWRRQPGNDGRVRVLVPEGALGRHPEGDQRAAPPEGTAAVESVLAALREAHVGEIGRLTGALGRAEARADAERARADLLLTKADGLRAEMVGIEAKLTAETARADDLRGRLAEAEQVKEAARKRAYELADRMMTLEAAEEEGRETKERLTVLDGLLADAERRLAEAEHGRRTAQERLDAQDRSEVERRGKGRWARLRAAWRGE